MDDDEVEELNSSTASKTFLEQRWFRVAAAIVTAVMLLSFIVPVLLPYFNGNKTQAQDTPNQDAIPDFILSAIDGSTVKLSERAALHSAIVLVFYRSASCSDCRSQLTEYQSSYQSIQSEGGEVIAIDLADEADARSMAEQLGVRFPMLYDGSTMATVYGLSDYLATDYTTVTMLVNTDMSLIGNPIGTQAGETLPASVVLQAIRQTATGSTGTQG